MKNRWKPVAVCLCLCVCLAGCNRIPREDYSNAEKPARELGELQVLAQPEGENMSPPSASAAEALAAMTQVAETDELLLYINLAYSFIAVENRQSGKVWFSNPPDYQRDELAGTGIVERMLSQLFVTYIARDGKQATMNNYFDSILRNQFVIRQLPNGVRVDYTLGEITRGADEIPKRIPAGLFEKAFLNNDRLSQDEKDEVDNQYRINEAGTEYEWTVMESDVYINRLLDVVDKCGYTKAELDSDAANEEKAAATQFTIPVEYTLEGSEFFAEVPLAEVKSASEEQIVRVDFLENFGSGFSTDDGYAFVPDGSGALMNYGKNVTGPRVSLPVFGDDATIDRAVTEANASNVRLPVFGAKNGTDAFLAEIVDGEAFADICVQKANYHSSYNTVFSSYQLLYNDFTKLANGSIQSQISVVQRQRYGGSLRVKYRFLTGDNANYAGMAALLRGDLIDTHQAQRLPAGAAPFFLETLGAVRMHKTTLGINHIGLETLTGFADTQYISEQLREKGITNQKIRLMGWMQGGMEQQLADRASPLGELGGKSGFKKLVQYTQNQGLSLYPDVEFLTAAVKSYNTYQYSAKTLDERFAKEYRYDMVTREKLERQDDIDILYRNIVTAAMLETLETRFNKSYQKLKLPSLSLGDLGEKVYADYRRTNNIDRQETAQQIKKLAGSLRGAYPDLMVSGGNSSTLGYVKSVVNMPADGSSYLVLDEAVPFYQIMVHGLLDYTLEPRNLSALSSSPLKSLEYGACPYYVLTRESSTMLKNTPFDAYSSVYYADWLDVAAEETRRAEPVLSEVRGQFITDHRKLADGVFMTVFESGKALVVNYNDTDFAYGNKSISKQSFLFG